MPRRKNVDLTVRTAAVGLVVGGFTGCGPTAPPLNSLTLLPTDASPSCTVAPATFNSWFVKTPITADGAVNPANSVTFPNIPNCSFYQWAMQDFLWLTSPTTSAYGGSGLILDSPAFFDVSPPAGSETGPRTLLAHSAGFIRPVVLRAAQVGPQGLQLTFDASGTPIQVKSAEAGAPLIVVNTQGERVQVEHAKLGRNGKPLLLDAKGSVIQTLASRETNGARDRKTTARIPALTVATKFTIDGIAIFTDPSLAVIDVEQGEADTNGVLEAQTSAGGSLIYYATIVNDVFAYYVTGVADGKISLVSDTLCTPTASAPCFPTTGPQLNQIVSFAAGHTTFPDANALAIEVKSAWVAAAGLPNLGSYITMNATIPTYTPSVPPPAGTKTLTATGQQTVQLALVSMHVVGSASGHPEMIWATFEHVNNAPAATYSYINTSGSTVAVNQNVSLVPTIGGSSAPWLFSSTSATSFNSQNMSSNAFSSPATITANGTGTISPSNTIRWKAFGASSDVRPNPADASIAASNTEIIAINNSVQSMLAGGDVRGNYILTGATWTVLGGAPPTGGGASVASCASIPATGCPVGTSALANTAMETYDQGKDTTLANGGSNCFVCHNGGNTTVVSHIFGAIKPLF